MSRTIHRLKPLAVDKAKTPGRHADGGGLYLVVKPGPRKSWAFIYRRDAKMTELGLGGVDAVSLSDARSEAAELRGVMATGGDPKCLIPGFDGAFFSPAWRDALWARFFTAAPQRQRRSVERYNIVKRA